MTTRTRFLIAAAMAAAVLIGNRQVAAIDISDPTITNPYLIEECLKSGGHITQAHKDAVAAQEAATRTRLKEAEDAAALAKALVPDGSLGGFGHEQLLRERYQADIARYGKYSVAICATGARRDYQQCLDIRAALAR